MDFKFDKDEIFYHGTQNDFSHFDYDMIGSSSGNMGFLGKGFYFSKDYDIAKCYGKVLSVKLDIINPFILDGILSDDTIDILNRVSDTYAFEYGMSAVDAYNGLSYGITDFPEMAELITEGLESLGYDGVVYNNGKEVVCFTASDIQILG